MDDDVFWIFFYLDEFSKFLVLLVLFSDFKYFELLKFVFGEWLPLIWVLHVDLGMDGPMSGEVHDDIGEDTGHDINGVQETVVLIVIVKQVAVDQHKGESVLSEPQGAFA